MDDRNNYKIVNYTSFYLVLYSNNIIVYKIEYQSLNHYLCF
jgi:hypothetical protein